MSFKPNNDSFFKKRIKSFGYAFNGIALLVKNEPHFKIHLAALTITVVFGWALKISELEWISILLISALVLALEAINTAIEKLVDLTEPDFNKQAKIIKDVSAAAVLIASMIAVIIAAIIFLPKISQLL